jgi:hypothetical protein
MNREALEEWLKVHSELLQKEREIAQIAILLARGSVSERHMDRVQLEITVLRERAETLFRTAFRTKN